MLIKIHSVKNKNLKRILEHIVYLAIIFILIPGFFYFELCIVLPVVVEEWTFAHFIHLMCATFLLVNIVGNMIYGMFTNTTIKGRYLDSFNKCDWTVCSVCECLRPPRAWHCNTCDICILKRDHHCTFFASCVGYFNHRYFILFTLYIFISMVYAFYYNVKFLATFITWNHGLVIIKFIFPLASFVIDFSKESLYVFLVVINFIIGIFSGFLFFYHFNNLLKGKVVPETKKGRNQLLYNRGWKANLIEVFGSRWYLTWISPFMHSPLPDA
ncbi:probable palmitoyltransferase ZDHHC24 isoform X2 [Achroia grisella]|uniref:probable palmitoyltransferase ZDHHC24 isoform X2 n=1 Tax=Achroia grisella TaxID=688607 RepID=UPI0027D32E83|nr:probable palmitoyltransferase ZDHHC24 isoform X2 [Achroia grisella]